MPRISIDLAPLWLRLAGAGFFAWFTVAIRSAVPDSRWVPWIGGVLAYTMLFFWQRVSFDPGQSWRYERGVLPFVVRTSGDFRSLAGIELRSAQVRNRDYGTTSEVYAAYLVWQSRSPLDLRLFSGRSFGAVAHPAVRLGLDIGLPILLDRDMHALTGRLADIQAQESAVTA